MLDFELRLRIRQSEKLDPNTHKMKLIRNPVTNTHVIAGITRI